MDRGLHTHTDVLGQTLAHAHRTSSMCSDTGLHTHTHTQNLYPDTGLHTHVELVLRHRLTHAYRYVQTQAYTHTQRTCTQTQAYTRTWNLHPDTGSRMHMELTPGCRLAHAHGTCAQRLTHSHRDGKQEVGGQWYQGWVGSEGRRLVGTEFQFGRRRFWGGAGGGGCTTVGMCSMPLKQALKTG